MSPVDISELKAAISHLKKKVRVRGDPPISAVQEH
jgi:hypothetical protein